MKVIFVLALLVASAFSFRIRQDAQADLTAATTDFQSGLGSAQQAVTDSLTAGQDALAAGTQQFQSLMGSLTSAATGGRLQQAASPVATVLADGQTVAGDLASSTQDFATSGEEVVEAGFDTFNQALDSLSGLATGGAAAAAPAARR